MDPSESETEIESALRDVFKKKGHKRLFMVLFAALILAALAATQMGLPVSLGQTPKQEDVAFVSQGDSDFQQRVKNITGYDWAGLIDADGNGKSKTAALMLLANEISALDDNYDFVNRSAGLGKGEIGTAALNASDNSNANFLKMAAGIKAANRLFLEKGMASAKARVIRLSVIENFFNKYPLPEGTIARNAQDIFAGKLGISVNDYSRLVSLMILNYDLFLAA